MTSTAKYLCGIGIIALVFVGVVLLAKPVAANPSQVLRNNPSTATTTPTYLNINSTTSTTTNTFNTQSDGGQAADKAAFTMCLTASSTATILNTAFEYSYDGGTWFQDNLASSTPTGQASIALVTPTSYSWTFASSSTGGGPIGGSSACKVLAVQTPLPWIRAIISVSGANGAVWSDFGARREQR